MLMMCVMCTNWLLQSVCVLMMFVDDVCDVY